MAKKNNSAVIPRPLNCFLIYRLEKQQEIVAKCSTANHRDISKIIAKWWKEATEEEKRPFREKARLAKIEHNKLYPGYKYAPRKKNIPRRVYIRKNKKETFTSRFEENNKLMEMIYDDPNVLQSIEVLPSDLKPKSARKAKLGKQLANASSLNVIDSVKSDMVQLGNYLDYNVNGAIPTLSHYSPFSEIPSEVSSPFNGSVSSFDFNQRFMSSPSYNNPLDFSYLANNGYEECLFKQQENFNSHMLLNMNTGMNIHSEAMCYDMYFAPNASVSYTNMLESQYYGYASQKPSQYIDPSLLNF